MHVNRLPLSRVSVASSTTHNIFARSWKIQTIPSPDSRRKISFWQNIANDSSMRDVPAVNENQNQSAHKIKLITTLNKQATKTTHGDNNTAPSLDPHDHVLLCDHSESAAAQQSLPHHFITK